MKKATTLQIMQVHDLLYPDKHINWFPRMGFKITDRSSKWNEQANGKTNPDDGGNNRCRQCSE